MTAEWWILLAGQIITVLGLGGVGWTIKAMKGTVDAQKETIAAQSEKMTSMETLLGTMKTVLTSTAEKNMLARLQAHKEFVEHEKAADAKRLTDQFEKEKQEMLRAATTGAEKIVEKQVSPLLDSLISLARNALPYVPKGQRQEFIDALNLEEESLRAVRAILNHIATAAPDLSGWITFSSRIQGLEEWQWKGGGDTAETFARRVIQTDPKHGGMDVKP